MRTKEIPRQEWSEFANAFSLRHAGWLVTLQSFGRELGAQELARDLPLAGVTADHEPGHEEITILLAESPDRHATHRVIAPVHLYLLQDDQGADEALEAETESGEKTILRFRSPMRPELVDGLPQEPGRSVKKGA